MNPRKHSEEELPAPMTLDEIRAAALSRYKAWFQLEVDKQSVDEHMHALLAFRDPRRHASEEIQAWVEANLGEPGPMRFSDEEASRIAAAYRKALVDHAIKHAQFIAAQHAQDIARSAIPPLPEASS